MKCYNTMGLQNSEHKRRSVVDVSIFASIEEGSVVVVSILLAFLSSGNEASLPFLLIVRLLQPNASRHFNEEASKTCAFQTLIVTFYVHVADIVMQTTFNSTMNIYRMNTYAQE